MKELAPSSAVPLAYYTFAHAGLAAASLLLLLEPSVPGASFYQPRMVALVHLLTIPWLSGSRGTPMSRVGVLQGTYLGIYINPVCEFWNNSLHCRFCTTGQNVGGSENTAKTIQDVVETCRAAKEQSGVTFVHLNGGFQGGHALEFVEPYVCAIKEQVGLLVGVQLTPERKLARYDRLIRLGVDKGARCRTLLHTMHFCSRASVILPGVVPRKRSYAPGPVAMAGCNVGLTSVC